MTIRQRVQTAALRLAFRMSRRTSHAGVELVDLTHDPECEALFFSKAPKAIDLIGQYDPRRFGTVQRLLNRIALVPDGGEYVHAGVATYLWTRPL